MNYIKVYTLKHVYLNSKNTDRLPNRGNNNSLRGLLRPLRRVEKWNFIRHSILHTK